MDEIVLEACVGSAQDALIAQTKGASQIELCDRLDLDGNTPLINLIKETCDILNIPIKVILNPKPFDYHYNQSELEEVVAYIHSLAELKVSGYVFGPVDKDGFPDLKALDYISEATSLPITYHKAVDASPDILKSVQMLCDHNVVSFILTSGGKERALDAVDKLTQMKDVITKAESNIQLIAAGRVTSSNLKFLHEQVNLKYYHGKLIVGKL